MPINGRSIINSDLVLELVNLPKTMIIVGGGVIGVEYTCMFAALGVRVTLIERRPRLMEFADQEIIEALSYHLRDSRVTMRLNEEVESCRRDAGWDRRPPTLRARRKFRAMRCCMRLDGRGMWMS